MKKLVTILFALMLTFSLSAQVSGGVKIGTNFATIASSDYYDYETRIGLQTGGFMVFEIGDVFQIKPELIYTQKGATIGDYYGGLGSYIVKQTVALNYLELPIYFGWNIAESGFCINTGPYFAILLSAKVKVDSNPYGISGNGIYDECSPIDMGLNFGVSYTIAEHFVIDSRYGIGLLNIENDEYYYDDIWINSVLSLSFGYQF